MRSHTRPTTSDSPPAKLRRSAVSRYCSLFALALLSGTLAANQDLTAAMMSSRPSTNLGPSTFSGDRVAPRVNPTIRPQFPGSVSPSITRIPGTDRVITDDGDKGPSTKKKVRKVDTGDSSTGGQHIRSGFFIPPRLDIHFVRDEVLLESRQSLDAIARRYHLVLLETQTFATLGRTLSRWRITDGRAPAVVIKALSVERAIITAQVNHVYFTGQTATTVPATTASTEAPAPAETAAASATAPLTEGDPAQYAIAKLHLVEAHRVATGNQVLVAVIDSGIDDTHPDLEGVIAAKFDAIGGEAKPHPHGTGMAGAIASHKSLMGVAPRVRLLAVRAFDPTDAGAEGTTFNILKGLDWSAAQGARIINMSFSGASDPALLDALAKVRKKGIVLVAAAGNAGPKSPPLYPAADPNVIGVTATDADDKLFRNANRGSYIAVAAPGVDILVPAPDASVQLTTGTSVAAAQVSGVAALLIERKPSLGPDEVRKILMATAKHFSPKGRDNEFGAGLIDAFAALMSLEPKSAKTETR